jgi:DNA polymerase III delta prime subunit
VNLIENTLWTEKWRPKKIDDCVLSKQNKRLFKALVANRDIPNMLFVGTAGVGKTTVAKALAAELGMDVMFIPASEKNGIDVLRNEIKSFASTVSICSDGLQKLVILDEADFLNPSSTQPALRSFIEEYSRNCRFIFTANYKNKIIEPLLSRLNSVEFTIPSNEKLKLADKIMKRIVGILKHEKVQIADEHIGVLAQVILKHFPDFRKTISEIQKYSIENDNTIDAGILRLSDVNVDELFKHLKTKNFNSMRKWVADNSDSEPNTLMRKIFDGLDKNMERGSIPQAILIIAEYMHRANFVVDHEINITAMCIQIMAECLFLKGE